MLLRWKFDESIFYLLSVWEDNIEIQVESIDPLCWNL